MNPAVIWHDVECGAYDADLECWLGLAADARGPVLDLGAGSGRVALRLAAAGHQVTALDSAPELLAALRARARDRDLRVRAELADVRSFSLGHRFDLAIAAMQVAQLLDAAGRSAMLTCVANHLRPGGRLAAALADPVGPADACELRPPLPDVRELDGWVYSSMPLAVRSEPGAVAIDHLRQSVSPEGALSDELTTVRLELLDAGRLESEAAGAGLRPLDRVEIPPTADHVGTTVVVLEAGR